jgi:hypothetical protein
MEFGKLEKVDLKEVWKKEAFDFTPWLSENIAALGEALGMDLELEEREANVGNFSLDLLARNLGTGEYAVIENQLTQTDHDHLGKLLTYAAGFDAATIIWVAESIRDEHRQTLEWLNQHTDTKTQFFAVVVEVFRIDDSKPAYKFRPIVFPNEWQKTKRQQAVNATSPRAEAYRSFFQKLIDELREKHKFTGARVGQPQNWYSFSSGISGFLYSASFAQGNRVRAEIYIDTGDAEKNKAVFDSLKADKTSIEEEFGEALSWERLDDKRASRVAIYRDGSINDNENQLEETQNWLIDNLLKFKRVFTDRVKRALDE